MVESVSAFLSEYLKPEVAVFLISLMPILELRGGLVAAKLMGVPWLTAYPLSIIGNMLPVPFIILFIERILIFLKQHGPIKKLATFIWEKGKRAGEKLQTKYPKSLLFGLFLFTAIPLPGTGAWTGSLAAALLGIPPRKSAPAICLGVIGASIIMSILTYLVPGLFGF